MSKIVIILVFIFWAALSVFFVKSLFGKNNQPAANQANITIDNNQSLTKDVVSQHGKISDCWVIYKNNVYDVTSFISSHPGGEQAIIPYCGQDMTAAFDGMMGHGGEARQILNGLEIGSLSY